VIVPPLSEAARKAALQAKSREQAIALVKSAKLYVKGEGQATDTVGYIVESAADFHRRAGGFNRWDWSAELGKGTEWIVTLTFDEARSTSTGKQRVTKTAQWAVDFKTRRVRYLDPNAKGFSYLPPY
jgi:hypothetical protein